MRQPLEACASVGFRPKRTLDIPGPNKSGSLSRRLWRVVSRRLTYTCPEARVTVAQNQPPIAETRSGAVSCVNRTQLAPDLSRSETNHVR